MIRHSLNCRTIKLLTILLLLCLVYSCSWAPSDEEAVTMVKNYYLFNYGGKEVDARIVSRGEYIEACKCYPVLFQINIPDRESFRKTFYFFKNSEGKVEASEFQSEPLS